MTDETQGLEPTEDAPLLPEEQAADSSTAPEAQAEPEPKTPQPRDEDGKFSSERAQRRFDQLTWEKNQAAREAEYWRQLASQNQPKPEPEKPTKLPTLEEHGYDEAKYQAALLDYSREIARQEAKSLLESERKQQTEQKRAETFAERQREFIKNTPDFEDKVLRDPTLPITSAMRDVIVDSDNGPELAYYLANNREAAVAISRLPPHLAALEMGRIDGRLAAQKEAAKSAPKAPPVSKAPPPPPKVEATEVEVEKDPDDMSVDEWVKWRNKQLRRKK
jgi:hypothetical protein